MSTAELAAAGGTHLYVGETGSTGRGLFTSRAFRRGEIVFTVTGELIHWISQTAEQAALYPNWIGIGPGRWIDPVPPFDRLNHSCDPNLGIADELTFVALRGIAVGDELTFDYSITEDETLWEMQCLCGLRSCRGTIRSIQFLPRPQFARYLPYIGAHFQAVYERSWQTDAVKVSTS